LLFRLKLGKPNWVILNDLKHPVVSRVFRFFRVGAPRSLSWGGPTFFIDARAEIRSHPPGLPTFLQELLSRSAAGVELTTSLSSYPASQQVAGHLRRMAVHACDESETVDRKSTQPPVCLRTQDRTEFHCSAWRRLR